MSVEGKGHMFSVAPVRHPTSRSLVTGFVFHFVALHRSLVPGAPGGAALFRKEA